MLRIYAEMMYSTSRAIGFDDARGGGRACGGSAGGPSEHRLSLRAGAGRRSRAGRGGQGEQATCDARTSVQVQASELASSRMF